MSSPTPRSEALFVICMTWQGGNKRWQPMSSTCSIYWCLFSIFYFIFYFLFSRSKNKCLWHKPHEIWFKCLRQGQMSCQWLAFLIWKLRRLQFSSKNFALHSLKGTHLHIQKHEIFCTWVFTLTLTIYSRLYQILDPP